MPRCLQVPVPLPSLLSRPHFARFCCAERMLTSHARARSTKQQHTHPLLFLSLEREREYGDVVVQMRVLVLDQYVGKRLLELEQALVRACVMCGLEDVMPRRSSRSSRRQWNWPRAGLRNGFVLSFALPNVLVSFNMNRLSRIASRVFLLCAE